MYKSNSKKASTIICNAMLTTLLCMVLSISIAQPLPAPPDFISYHGQIKQMDGSPVDPGAYDVEISIYDAPVDGEMVWGPFIFDGALGAGHAAKAYVMNDGRFSVLLGPVDTANRKIRDGIRVDGVEKRFVNVRIGDLSTAVDITPRQQLLSGTYAFQAYQAAGVGPLINYGNGNYGLGVDEPTARLDVNGNVKVSGVFESGEMVATSVEVDSANFVSLATGSSVIHGDAIISGNVTGQMNLENTQQSSFVRVQATGQGEQHLEGTDKTWFCSLSSINAAGANICEVKFDQLSNQWILFTRVLELGSEVSCRANCIKLQ